MKKTMKYILIGVIGVLAASSILMTIETATSGAEVASLQKKESILAAQKRSLEDSLVTGMSVNQLEASATSMGYVKPATLVYVNSIQPVAKIP